MVGTERQVQKFSASWENPCGRTKERTWRKGVRIIESCVGKLAVCIRACGPQHFSEEAVGRGNPQLPLLQPTFHELIFWGLNAGWMATDELCWRATQGSSICCLANFGDEATNHESYFISDLAPAVFRPVSRLSNCVYNSTGIPPLVHIQLLLRLLDVPVCRWTV